MKKRILAMLLAIVMIVGMVPVQAFATETEPAEVEEKIIETTEAVIEATEEETEEETTFPEKSEEETMASVETEYADVILEVEEEEACAAPSGETIGTVRVIVENATFTADEGASWDGILVDTQIALLDDMTMMTAILTALNENGHTWTGTGGETEDGWDITYISSINKDGSAGLAEMDGGSQSGWMGTLNDWFVNYGFEQWKAGDSLLDGDVICVMYTQSGYGADIGGAFESAEGYLSSLAVSAGTLDPAFVKETLEYTLTLDSGVTSLDVTAAAENKQDKVTVKVGDTEYRRGENVAVADGSQITIVCGERVYAVTVAVEEPAPASPLNVTAGGNAMEVKFVENSNDQNWYLVSVSNVNLQVSGTEENPLTEASDAKTNTGFGVVDGSAAVAVKDLSAWALAELPAEITGCLQTDTENCYAIMFALQNSLGTSGGKRGFLFVEFNCDHTWSDATCQAPKTCSKCDMTEGELGNHSFVDGICSVCGISESAPAPFSQAISIPSNGNSSWGYVSGLTLSGTDGSIYEAYWSSVSNPFVVDVILGQDTDLDATITAGFSVAGLRAPSIKGTTEVALVDGKGTITVTAERGVTFYDTTTWTINLVVDDGSAALRPAYEVTLPADTVGYTVEACNSTSPVISGRSFSFKITIPHEYTTEENFAVKANDTVLTAVNGIYTIENITEDQIVTVVGIRPKTLAELNVTVIAPAGSAISTGRFYSYFKYDFDEPIEVTTLEDGSIQYIAPVPGSQNFLRVQHPDGVTYWNFDNMTAGSKFEITEEMLFIGSDEFTKDTVYADYEMNIMDKADLYLTVNEKGWLDMATGDTWNLNVFRNFLSLGNSISNNSVALPDTHYQVIDFSGNPSDVVSVTPDANNSCYAEIKAEKAGTAIILVTYDAVYNNKGEGGKQWSALWPENTGVIVVSVDAPDGSVDTNMTINTGFNTTGKQVIDAEHDILFYVGNNGASYSFKPEEGATVTVNRSTVGSEMTFGGFTDSNIYTAADGTVSVKGLTTGTHIIRVEKDGVAAYQVVRARKVSYEVLHSDGTLVTASSPAQPGETVTVQFHNLVSPMEKMSGVYNANFGFCYYSEEGVNADVKSASTSPYGVYTFSGNENLQKFTVVVPEYWNETSYSLTDGGIKIGGWGSSAGAHRTTTYIAGKEVNTDASGVAGVLSSLPEVLINTEPCGYESFYVTLPTGNGYTVTGDTKPIPEGGSYTFTVSVQGGYDAENMEVLVNGKVIEAVEGVYMLENIRENKVITVEGVMMLPTVDMTDAAVIFTSAENGTDWGRPDRAYVDMLTMGGAEVVSADWDGNNGTVVLSYDTPSNAVVGFALTFGGRNASWMNASVDGIGMTQSVPVSVKLANGAATVAITAGYNKYIVTKTICVTVQEMPDEVAQAIASVEELISAIELPVDLEDEATIRAAWDAYDTLPEKVKKQVTNADILLQAIAELEDMKAVKLVSGKSVTLKSTLSGKLTWFLDKEYAPFASITSAGKLTAKKVLEKVSVYATATDGEGNVETLRIDIFPAVSQVKILDCEGNLLNSKTIPVKVNATPEGIAVFSDGSDGIYTFSAGTYPEDAMGDVTWTVSDKTGAYVTYEIVGNDIILQPAEGVKKGTVTLTAAATDGSNKKATLKLNIAVLVEDISVTTGNGKNLTNDEEGNSILTVASGKAITLKADPTNANATNKAVTWSIVEGGEYATVSTSGKLTAVKDLMAVKYAVVRATAKDGGGTYTDTKVRITPLALGVQIYNNGRVCTGLTRSQNMTTEDTLALNARVYPLGKANQSVTWTTSNEKIASITVDGNGAATVTCLKAGKVTITATADDGSKEKATFTLNIVQGVESLTLEDQVIAVKKSLNLAKLVKINPTTATNTKLTWAIVGDAHGAKLSAAGVLDTKKVDVSNGPVAITVSASAMDGWGAEAAVCTVTVYPATKKNTMVVMNGDQTVTGTLELEVGKTLTLKGFCEGAANVYTWKSNNKNVQVEDGVITASEAAVGKTATITCTAADGTNIAKSVKVTIVAPAAE